MVLKLGGNDKTFNKEMNGRTNKGIMPFGTHEDKPIDEIPSSYLGWIVHQEWLKDPLKSKLEEEFNKRKEEKDCFGHLEEGLRRCKKCPYHYECAKETEKRETSISYDDINLEDI